MNNAPAVTEFTADVESESLALGDEINFTALEVRQLMKGVALL